MTEREKALEESVKELGKWLSNISHGGKFNPAIADALERGRNALKVKNENK